MLLPVLTAWILGQITARRLRSDPHHRGDIARRYSRGKLLQLYGLMATHLVALAVGWGWAAEQIGGPATELLRMLPFLIGLALGWAGYYPADRSIQGDAPARAKVSWAAWSCIRASRRLP